MHSNLHKTIESDRIIGHMAIRADINPEPFWNDDIRVDRNPEPLRWADVREEVLNNTAGEGVGQDFK